MSLGVARREKNKEAVEVWVAIQFIFDRQWMALKVRLLARPREGRTALSSSTRTATTGKLGLGPQRGRLAL